MNYIKYVFILLLLLASCKTKKNIVEGNNVISKISNRKIIKNYNANTFNKKSIDAKYKVNFKNKNQDLSFNLQAKIKTDEVIYLKGTKMITVFKAKITPEKISYYSPFFKNYLEGDFKMITKILGTKINFKQLQSLFTGESLFDIEKNKQNIVFENNKYVISPKQQFDLFDIFLTLNSENFKIHKQSIVSKSKSKRLDINYPKYLNKENCLFPEQIKVIAKKINSATTIDLLIRSLTFDNEIKVPFSIPSGYKKIEL